MNKTNASAPQKENVKSAQQRVSDYLQSHVKDGWWPYSPGNGPSIETTAWCLLSAPEKNVLAGLDFLIKNQNADGGWPTAPGEGYSAWCSGLALFALRTASKTRSQSQVKNSLKRGVEYLIDTRTEFYSGINKTIIAAIRPEELEGGRGWPWSKGCFHWVEPTSYNLYALKVPTLIGDNKDNLEVIKKANRFLVDNTCAAGGWNHGSHLALGVNLPPYIVTTAEALLALQDLPNHPAVIGAFKFLGENSEATIAGQTKSAMALAWMTLAYHAYGKPTHETLSHLLAIQHDDGSFGPNIMVTALSALALGTEDGANPFKYSWSNPKTTP